MQELTPIDPKSLKVGMTYFVEGLLAHFMEEQKNSRSSYFIFEPLPGQRTKRLIKLGEMKLRHTCFATPAGYYSQNTQTETCENKQLSLF